MTVWLQLLYEVDSAGKAAMFTWSTGHYTADGVNILVPAGMQGVGAWIRATTPGPLLDASGHPVLDANGNAAVTNGSLPFTFQSLPGGT